LKHRGAMFSATIRTSSPRLRTSGRRYRACEAPESGDADAGLLELSLEVARAGRAAAPAERVLLVKQPVDYGGRHHFHFVAGPDLRPVLHGTVRRDDRAPALVVVGAHLPTVET
jgi:hypothetical protein